MEQPTYREQLLLEIERSETSKTMLIVSLDFENTDMENKVQQLTDQLNGKYGYGIHVTLALTPIQDSDSGDTTFEMFANIAEDILKESRPFITVSTEELITSPETGFVAFEVNSDSLKRVHKLITEEINKVRGRITREKDKKRIAENPENYSDKELENILTNGNERSGDSYNPHITILNPEEKNQLINEMEEVIKAFGKDFKMDLRPTSISIKTFPAGGGDPIESRTIPLSYE